MWIIKKTKQAFVASRPHQEAQEYKLIHSLINIEGNVVPIRQLEPIASLTFDLEKCQIAFQIISDKIERYRNRKPKLSKLFKTLVITDYLLLNGTSALVDLFQDNLGVFERLSVSPIEGQPNLAGKELEMNSMVTIKAQHICLILKDKEKRLSEKLALNQAKLMMKKDPRGPRSGESNQSATGQSQSSSSNQYPHSFLKKRPPALKSIEKFMQKKLIKLTTALLGLLDQDYELYDDHLKNKEFMEREQNIIEDQAVEVPPQSEPDPATQESPAQDNPNQNLLDLEIQFL